MEIFRIVNVYNHWLVTCAWLGECDSSSLQGGHEQLLHRPDSDQTSSSRIWGQIIGAIKWRRLASLLVMLLAGNKATMGKRWLDSWQLAWLCFVSAVKEWRRFEATLRTSFQMPTLPQSFCLTVCCIICDQVYFGLFTKVANANFWFLLAGQKKRKHPSNFKREAIFWFQNHEQKSQ